MKIKKFIGVVLFFLIVFTVCWSVMDGIFDILHGGFLKFSWLVPVGYVALVYLYIKDKDF